MPLKKRRVHQRSFFAATPLSVFFFGPPGRQSHLNSDLVHISPPEKKTGNLAHFFGETAFGFSVAPSEGKANLDCYPVVISPRKKPPGTWVFFFGGESASGFFCAPWRKIKFEFRPGTRFATKDNDGVPGFSLRRNRLFFLIVLGR